MVLFTKAYLVLHHLVLSTVMRSGTFATKTITIILKCWLQLILLEISDLSTCSSQHPNTLFTVKSNSIAFDINELSCVTSVRSDLIDSKRVWWLSMSLLLRLLILMTSQTSPDYQTSTWLTHLTYQSNQISHLAANLRPSNQSFGWNKYVAAPKGSSYIMRYANMQLWTKSKVFYFCENINLK